MSTARWKVKQMILCMTKSESYEAYLWNKMKEASLFRNACPNHFKYLNKKQLFRNWYKQKMIWCEFLSRNYRFFAQLLCIEKPSRITKHHWEVSYACLLLFSPKQKKWFNDKLKLNVFLIHAFCQRFYYCGWSVQPHCQR